MARRSLIAARASLSAERQPNQNGARLSQNGTSLSMEQLAPDFFVQSQSLSVERLLQTLERRQQHPL